MTIEHLVELERAWNWVGEFGFDEVGEEDGVFGEVLELRWGGRIVGRWLGLGLIVGGRGRGSCWSGVRLVRSGRGGRRCTWDFVSSKEDVWPVFCSG